MPVRVTKLRGHQGPVLCAAANPHCVNEIATGGEDAAVCLWRAGVCHKRLLGTSEPVGALAFDRRCPHRLYAAAGSRIFAFDFDVPGDVVAEPVYRLRYAEDDINSLTAHDSLPLLVSGDDDGAVCFIDTDTRKLIRICRLAHASICAAVSFRPGGGAQPSIDLATSGFDHRVQLWRSASHAKAVGVGSIVGGAVLDVELAPEEPVRGQRGSRGKGGGRGGAVPRRQPPAPQPPTSEQGEAGTEARLEQEGDQKGGSEAAVDQSSQMLNPPFVHAIAWHPSCPDAFAVACGDGTVAILLLALPQAAETAAAVPVGGVGKGGGGAPLSAAAAPAPAPSVQRVLSIPRAHSAAATTVGFLRLPTKLVREGRGSGGSGLDTGGPAAAAVLTKEEGQNVPDHQVLMFSAGNDGWIRLWTVADVLSSHASPPAAPSHLEGSPLEGGAPARLWLEIHHGRGPNWVQQFETGGGGGGGGGYESGLAVCDTSSRITCYEWPRAAAE